MLEKGHFQGHPNLICELVSITFTLKKNQYAHKKNVHSEDVFDGSQHSPMCSKSFRAMSQLHLHLQNEHDVQLKVTKCTFYTEGDFLEWKKKKLK